MPHPVTQREIAMAVASARAETAAGATEIDPIDLALRGSESSLRTPRMAEGSGADPVAGAVSWKPGK